MDFIILHEISLFVYSKARMACGIAAVFALVILLPKALRTYSCNIDFAVLRLPKIILPRPIINTYCAHLGALDYFVFVVEGFFCMLVSHELCFIHPTTVFVGKH